MSKHSTGFQSDPFSSKPCESCESKRWAIKDICYACGKDCCDKCATHVGGNKLICAECKESQDAEQAPTCPTCGEETTFTAWSDASDEWLACDKCGAKTDEAEVTA